MGLAMIAEELPEELRTALRSRITPDMQARQDAASARVHERNERIRREFSALPDPQRFARSVLDDIEVATAEAVGAVDDWDADRLRRAFADIAAHVETWERGPVAIRPANREERCSRCGGLNGSHGLVHTRHGNGGGTNRQCPNSDGSNDV